MTAFHLGSARTSNLPLATQRVGNPGLHQNPGLSVQPLSLRHLRKPGASWVLSTSQTDLDLIPEARSDRVESCFAVRKSAEDLDGPARWKAGPTLPIAGAQESRWPKAQNCLQDEVA